MSIMSLQYTASKLHMKTGNEVTSVLIEIKITFTYRVNVKAGINTSFFVAVLR